MAETRTIEGQDVQGPARIQTTTSLEKFSDEKQIDLGTTEKDRGILVADTAKPVQNDIVYLQGLRFWVASAA